MSGPVETMTSLPSVPVIVPAAPSIVGGLSLADGRGVRRSGGPDEPDGGRYDEDRGQQDAWLHGSSWGQPASLDAERQPVSSRH